MAKSAAHINQFVSRLQELERDPIFDLSRGKLKTLTEQISNTMVHCSDAVTQVRVDLAYEFQEKLNENANRDEEARNYQKQTEEQVEALRAKLQEEVARIDADMTLRLQAALRPTLKLTDIPTLKGKSSQLGFVKQPNSRRGSARSKLRPPSSRNVKPDWHHTVNHASDAVNEPESQLDTRR